MKLDATASTANEETASVKTIQGTANTAAPLLIGSGIKLQPIVELCPICKSNNASQRCIRKICKGCCLKFEAEEEMAAMQDKKQAQSLGNGRPNDEGDNNINGNTAAEDSSAPPAGNNGEVVVLHCEAHAAKIQKIKDKKERSRLSKEAKKQAGKSRQSNEKKQVQKQPQQQQQQSSQQHHEHKQQWGNDGAKEGQAVSV